VEQCTSQRNIENSGSDLFCNTRELSLYRNVELGDFQEVDARAITTTAAKPAEGLRIVIVTAASRRKRDVDCLKTHLIPSPANFPFVALLRPADLHVSSSFFFWR
jgi:hypothetical protein